MITRGAFKEGLVLLACVHSKQSSVKATLVKVAKAALLELVKPAFLRLVKATLLELAKATAGL
jgi:hypothetical protein